MYYISASLQIQSICMYLKLPTMLSGCKHLRTSKLTISDMTVVNYTLVYNEPPCSILSGAVTQRLV